MAETQAASSPAEVVDVFNGQSPTFAEYSQYRQTGELPERFKPAEPAESAPADGPEETVAEGEQPESVSESASEESAQEPQTPKKHRTAEERKAQLRATVERLWQQDEPDTVKIAQLEATIDKIDAGLKRKAAPAPAVQQPQQPQAQQAAPQQQYTRPKPTPDAQVDGKAKYATYEDYVEDLSRWNGEQLLAQYQQQQAAQAAEQALATQFESAKAHYGDDEGNAIVAAAQTLVGAKIHPIVWEAIRTSDLFPHLCYVIGTDGEGTEGAQKFASLAKTNVRAALAQVFEYERGIREELSQSKETPARSEDGKFKAPEPKKTAAPKPPSPVSGGTSRGAFDASDESLSPDEWMRKRNEELARKGRR